MGAREVMRQVREGYRLEKPKHCKHEFYKVVTKCWHSDPTKRPSFTELKQDIGNLLGDKESEGGYVDLEALAEEMCDQQGHWSINNKVCSFFVLKKEKEKIFIEFLI